MFTRVVSNLLLSFIIASGSLLPTGVEAAERNDDDDWAEHPEKPPQRARARNEEDNWPDAHAKHQQSDGMQSGEADPTETERERPKPAAESLSVTSWIPMLSFGGGVQSERSSDGHTTHGLRGEGTLGFEVVLGHPSRLRDMEWGLDAAFVLATGSVPKELRVDVTRYWENGGAGFALGAGLPINTGPNLMDLQPMIHVNTNVAWRLFALDLALNPRTLRHAVVLQIDLLHAVIASLPHWFTK